MGENNKSYRIRTTVGRDADTFLNVHLDQDYNTLEILSLKISDKDVYKLHNADYGVVVGRVLANGNFGVPNAKISVFIEADQANSNLEMWELYPYASTSTKNSKDIRYNLLPDQSVKDCHKAVGTFPNKTYLLDNDVILEVFDKYYVYTTRTNAAGDYLICGVPTGMQTIHMDLDLSDCGILSQRPRDFVYKGYTIEQFENPNQFKKDENLDSLAQIFTQNQPVYVQPFWGNEENGDTIGITRADIEISFKFEPTCVFMGSAISDNASNGVGKKCVPTNQMGYMEELTAGEGTIEMIRKTPGGNVEEFSIKGNQLINGNGVWCYQIPMNLDYMMTDEYGNMVPTDDPEKGIPTRTRVRFRASLTDMEESSQSYYRAKYLIPNNPEIDREKVDYNFGTYTDDDSYRDLFWNGVYTVKSYIPRFQKSKNWRNERFSGIKNCNYYGNNNPMPYNNLRIKLPFMFTVLCIFVKLFIKIVTLLNRVQGGILRIFRRMWLVSAKDMVVKRGLHCTFIGDGLCPDMEGWYFAPACGKGLDNEPKDKIVYDLLVKNTMEAITSTGDEPGEEGEANAMDSTEYSDETSIDNQNTTANEEENACLTFDIDYLVNCFEMNLANEYRVIKFDFYNDWINGVIYFPRWMRKVKRKKKYKLNLKNPLKGGLIKSYYKDKVQGCMNSEDSRVKKSRYYTQQCSILHGGPNNRPWTVVKTLPSCSKTTKSKKKNKDNGVTITPGRCHKKPGMLKSEIFGKKSGLVTEEKTMLGQNVYYLKPCEWNIDKDTKEIKRTLLFATDIILLGTLNDCDENGIPQAFQYLNNTSYIMPTNLALTTMDDDSYIYGGSGGTICASAKKPEVKMEESVRRVTPDYESTYYAYSNTESDVITYENNDDPIPVTESAGISWNYSGPGQDDVASGKKETPLEYIKRLFSDKNKKYKYLYYPGGHFLGLSCVNAESNIKSCVNLQRICEMGATMSQRREELRGYDQDTGAPKYKYYVPTGLISNVDIEGAAFRAMFATLNHNKLIATDVNETTGYDKYKFRFLYPDGFDGAMALYVHLSGSPYNTEIKYYEDEPIIKDATLFFEKLKNLFPSWSRPDDYDEEEPENTKRRTVEESIDDYYMFRFGLDTFKNEEQKKHYLVKTTDTEDGSEGYGLPQYENSFYFYFGLKDGSTALDEFKKQFFSQCESNTIARTPSINVKTKVSECLEPENVTLITENMHAPFNVKVKDITADGPEIEFTENRDIFNLLNYSKAEDEENYDIEYIINHEYTITITDSLDQTLTKTFTVGEHAVNITASVVNFRLKIEGERPGDKNLRQGGYIKVNDNIKILNSGLSLDELWHAYSEDDPAPVEVKFYYSMDGISEEPEVLGESGQSDVTYIDTNGYIQQVFYLPGITESGTSCTIYVTVQPYGCTTGSSYIPIYSSEIYDNRDVELYVGSDYLSYKSEPGIGLSAITEDDWENQDARFTGTEWYNWLMRHTFYRQTPDPEEGFNSKIYASPGGNVSIFGQPESGNTNSGGVLSDRYLSNDYGLFPGYSLDASYSFIPTVYSPINREHFDAMAFNADGRAAADVTTTVVESYNYDSGSSILTLICSSIDDKILDGHGAVAILEDGTVLNAIKNGSSLEAHFAYDIYANLLEPEEKEDMRESYRDRYEQLLENQLNDLLGMISVYPTMLVPVIFKPFYGEVSAVTWNVEAAINKQLENGSSMIAKEELPLSYKIQGVIYNGLTFNDHFALGNDSNHLLTYMLYPSGVGFYNLLTVNTSEDYDVNRKIDFGKGDTTTYEIHREVAEIPAANTQNAEDIDTLRYLITEGTPDESNEPSDEDLKMLAKSGFYSNDYNLETIKEDVGLDIVFYDKIRVMSFAEPSEDPLSLYYLHAERAVTKDTHTRITEDEFFKDAGLLEFNSENKKYCIGYYNQNVKYDKKGTYVSVKKLAEDNFEVPITQKNGTIKRVTGSEESLKTTGVTLCHKYVLEDKYKEDFTLILKAYNAAEEYNMGIGDKKGDLSTITAGTVICRYENSKNTSKNKLAVYKIYDLHSLDVVFAPDLTGSEDTGDTGTTSVYLDVNTSLAIDSSSQTRGIPVSTNVGYTANITTGGDWLQAQTTSTGIQVTAEENQSTEPREAKIVVKGDSSENISYNGDDSDEAQTGITITVTQNAAQPGPEPPTPQPEITLTPTGATVGYEAGSTSFSFTTTNIDTTTIGVWCDNQWVNNIIKNENTVTLNYDLNNDAQRIATITVSGLSSVDGTTTVQKQFSLTQQGGLVREKHINLKVDTDISFTGRTRTNLTMWVLATSLNGQTAKTGELRLSGERDDAEADIFPVKYTVEEGVENKVNFDVYFTSYTDYTVEHEGLYPDIAVYYEYNGKKTTDPDTVYTAYFRDDYSIQYSIELEPDAGDDFKIHLELRLPTN